MNETVGYNSTTNKKESNVTTRIRQTDCFIANTNTRIFHCYTTTIESQQQSSVVSICSLRVWCKQQIVSNLHRNVYSQHFQKRVYIIWYHQPMKAACVGMCRVHSLRDCTSADRRSHLVDTLSPHPMTVLFHFETNKPTASTVFPGNPDPETPAGDLFRVRKTLTNMRKKRSQVAVLYR